VCKGNFVLTGLVPNQKESNTTMNLDAIKSKLDRLNRFYEFMASNPDEISKLDQDSFLMQLRELYTLVIDADGTPVLESPVKKEVKEEPKKEELQEKKAQKRGAKFVFNTSINESKTEVKEETKQEIPKKEEPKAEVVKEPVKEEVKKVEVKKEEPKVEVVKEPIKKEEPKKEEPKAEVKTSFEDKSDTDFKEDFEELFVYKQATDLAAKLSESPIKDLNEKLGLNEKFHYINELFGGDVAKFKQSIDYLNSAENFDNARRYMEKELVEQFDWMKKLKKTLAKDFIKLVRRRYM
jgi:hypothetical protein